MFRPGVHSSHPSSAHRFLASGLIAAMAFFSAARLAAAPGDLDPTFSADVSGAIHCLALRQDGSLVIGGNFQQVNGTACNKLAILSPTGALVAALDGGHAGLTEPTCMAIDAGGRVLVGSSRLYPSAALARALQRFTSGGLPDPGFTPGITWNVNSVALQKDGKILVAGYDDANSGTAMLTRLNADGSVDPTFIMALGEPGNLRRVLVLADGKIMISGRFIWKGNAGTGSQSYARLLASGARDTTFSTYSATVRQMEEEAGEKVLLTGQFPTGSGSETQTRRITQGGGNDGGWLANGEVDQISQQGNGGLIACGTFTTFRGVTRPGIARLLAGGEVDTSVNWNLTGTVTDTLLQPDGSIIAAGSFRAPGDTADRRIARLQNTPGTLTLEKVGGNVRLVSSGGAPVFGQVRFGRWSATAPYWAELPAPVRTGGVWQVSGATLPENCTLIVKGEMAGGTDSSSALVKSLRLGNAAPELSLKSHTTVLPHGSARIDLGRVPTGWQVDVKLDLANTGADVLENLAATLADGTKGDLGAAFSATRLEPGTTGTATLSFLPTVPGSHTAEVRIASNDPDESPYLLYLDYTAGDTVDFVFRNPAEPAYSASTVDVDGKTLGTIRLAAVPAPGSQLTAIATPLFNGVTGRFTNLPDGGYVTAEYAGVTYLFVAGYRGGGGLTLTLVGPGTPLPGFSAPDHGQVNRILPEDDGSLLIGGTGNLGGAATGLLVRLRPDGSVDPAYGQKVSGTEITSLHRLPSGKYLVCGNITAIGQTAVSHIARLNGDGTLDTTFTARPNQPITAAAIQADGKILIGGSFSSVNSVARNRVARLNEDGTPDADFNPKISGTGMLISALRVQPDGKILVAGNFSSIGSPVVTVHDLVRLHPDGTRDTTFNAGFKTATDSAVETIALQRDGSIVVAGTMSYPGTSGGKLILLGPTGTRLSYPANLSGTTTSILLQEDGRYFLGGSSLFDGGVIPGGGRYLADGHRDPTFNLRTGAAIRGLALDAMGKLLTGQSFSTTFSGVECGSVARLENDASAAVTEITGGSRLRWFRGATAPMARRVFFEVHQFGVPGWSPLGDATYSAADGWVLEGATLPAHALVRGRAAISGEETSYLATTHFPAIGGAVPAAILRDAAGADLTGGAHLHFGAPVMPPFARNLTLRLENQGTAELADLTYTITGPHAADFRLLATPAARLAVAEGIPLPLTFAPTGGGTRTAELSITSSDPAAPVITLTLEGQATTTFSPVFDSPTDVYLEGPPFDPSQIQPGTLTLGFAPVRGTTLTAFRNTTTTALAGLFAGSPRVMTTVYGGVTHRFLIDYKTGNNITLRLITPDTADIHFTRPALNYYYPASIAVPPGGRVFCPSGSLRSILPDGQEDTTIPTVPTSGDGSCILVQDDGKMVLRSTTGVIRLLPDLTVDPTFNAQTPLSPSRIYQLRDGRIFLAGEGGPVLLHPDGRRDTSYQYNNSGGTYGGESTLAVAQQADGRLLIGGTSSGIIRIHPDGTPDPTFQFTTGSSTSGGGRFVSCILVQPDGKILVGGHFDIANGSPRSRLVRLHPDGTTDETFTASANQVVTCLLRQNSGHLLIGGDFTTVNGQPRGGLARLHPDGTLDTEFDALPPYDHNEGRTVTMRQDGSLLVLGSLLPPPGVSSRQIVRLFNEPLVSTVTATPGSGITWTRNALASDFMYTTFELCADGTEGWVPLGDGIRTADGWRLDFPALPASGIIRATGRQASSNRASAVTIETHLYGRQNYTAIELARKQLHGEYANAGPAANTADPDGDGLKNLIEYGLGLNPTTADPAAAPVWTAKDGGHEITFTPPAGLPLTYAAEWSETMNTDDWHPAQDLSQGAAKTFRVPQNPATKLFFRLKFSE